MDEVTTVRFHDGPLGLALKLEDASIVVDAVRPSSPACGRVVVGDEVIQVDGHPPPNTLAAFSDRLRQNRPIDLAFAKASATRPVVPLNVQTPMKRRRSPDVSTFLRILRGGGLPAIVDEEDVVLKAEDDFLTWSGGHFRFSDVVDVLTKDEGIGVFLRDRKVLFTAPSEDHSALLLDGFRAVADENKLETVVSKEERPRRRRWFETDDRIPPLRPGTRCELLWSETGFDFRVEGDDEEEGDDPAVALVRRTFVKGTYCKCVVLRYDEAQEEYDLGYEAGPYDATDDFPVAVGLGLSSEKPFGFFGVKRAHIAVDYADLPVRRLPVFVVFMSLVQLICFFVIALKRSEIEDSMAGPEFLWMRVVGRFPGCRDKRPQAWRYLSYALVHASYRHVLFNVILQIIFGVPLEVVHGTLITGLIYVIGVAVGGLTSAVLRPYDAVVGASGGIYAFMGCNVANLAVNWRRMRYGALNRYARLMIFAVLLAVDVLQYAASPQANVSYTTHLGGYVAGFTVAFAILTDLADNSRRWPRRALITGTIASLLVLGLALLVAFDWPPASLRFSSAADSCCETLLSCDGLDPRDYAHLSCADGNVNFPGFYNSHDDFQGATCPEILTYVSSRRTDSAAFPLPHI